MKHFLKLLAVGVLVLTIGATGVRAQGSLTPPGAPAPTMKTLDQIEARTPISSLPFTISASGSYYLTGNLSVISGDGITINADEVTLDLNGYTVSSTASAVGGTGIVLNGGQQGIHIRNGTVAGTQTYSGTAFSGGGFNNGIAAYAFGDYSVAYDVTISQVAVSGCGAYGINLPGADSGTVVERCQVRAINGYGIVAAVVANCSASQCNQDGINGGVVRDSVGDNVGTTSSGIAATAITRSVGTSAKCVGIYTGAVVTGSYATSAGSGGFGISAVCAVDCNGAVTGSSHPGLTSLTALNCSGTNDALGGSPGLGLSTHAANGCFGSGLSGISTDVALGCYATGTTGNALAGTLTTGTGMLGCVAENCRAITNGANGILGAAVLNCYGQSAQNTGIIALTAMGCTGQGFPGLQCPVVNGCTGIGPTTVTGISANGGTVFSSNGSSGSAAGINASIAFGCFGSTNGSTNPGIAATLVNTCYGNSLSSTAVSATYKYNTP